MKQIIIFYLMLVIFSTGFAQKNSPANPGMPCCRVIAVSPATESNIVTARDNATCRTFEFSVDNSMLNNYTVGKVLNAQPSLGIIKSVSGTVSKYAFSEPVISAQPCCAIISIEPGPTCCSIVSAKATEPNEPPDGNSISFSVSKTIAANLEIGQKVSVLHFQPVDGDKYQPVDGYAVVHLNEGSSLKAKMVTYSFPVLKRDRGSNNNSDSSRSGGWDTKNNKAEKHEVNNSLFNDKPWEIKPNLAAKGATGRLFINIPKDAECVITISQPVTERQVVYSISDRSFSLVPGTYDVTVSGKKTKEVNVQKGMDTRIKGGALNVVATGTWTLYDEKRDRQVYYSVSPKKIGLPIGTYQLEINGTTQQVLIKDGETIDF